MKCFILLLLLVSTSGCAMLDQMVKGTVEYFPRFRVRGGE